MSHSRRVFLPLMIAGLSVATLGQQNKPAAQADAAQAQQTICVLGLDGVKHNAKGKLSISRDGLKFTGTATSGQIALAAIEDIFTDQDTRQTGGKTLTVAKMAVPYGGGRVLSLFTHEKFESLTVEYRDENGGLHGAVFTMPVGQAVGVKKELVAAGAKASTPSEDAATDAAKKEKQ